MLLIELLPSGCLLIIERQWAGTVEPYEEKLVPCEDLRLHA